MKRPHIIINAAMSVDGKIDTIARKGASISSQTDKERVMRLRAECDAVLVGGRTLLSEDPGLRVKSADLQNERTARGLSPDPARVAVVSEIPSGVQLPNFLAGNSANAYIFTTRRTTPEAIAALETVGAHVFVHDGERVDLPAMLATLAGCGIRTLMVEGGGTLIAALLERDLADELRIYVAAKIFGGASAPTLVDGPGWVDPQPARLQLKSVERFDEDGGVLIQYDIQHQ